MFIPRCGTQGFWTEYRLVMAELYNKKAFICKKSIWYQGPFEPSVLQKLKETIAHLEEKMKLLEAEHGRWLKEERIPQLAKTA